MSNVSALIDVFRMTELSTETREKIIRKLGRAINDSFGMNLTEPIVVELVMALNPGSKIKEEEQYARYVS